MKKISASTLAAAFIMTGPGQLTVQAAAITVTGSKGSVNVASAGAAGVMRGGVSQAPLMIPTGLGLNSILPSVPGASPAIVATRGVVSKGSGSAQVGPLTPLRAVASLRTEVPAATPQAGQPAPDQLFEGAEQAPVLPAWRTPRAKIMAGLAALSAAFGPGRKPQVLLARADDRPVPLQLSPKSPTDPKDGVLSPTIRSSNGILKPLTYYPGSRRKPFWRRLMDAIRFIPEKLRRIRTYRRQVHELVSAVTNEDLAWSLNRMEALASQEGILRSNNMEFINKWKHAAEALKALSPVDFENSSLSRESLMHTFKTAMDFEEPTLQYQYSFAQKLHNRHPRMSHFLGTTLQESLLAVALKGKAGQRSIWASEEVRHGPILVKVFNATRTPEHPSLYEQGSAPRLPHKGTEKMARSNMGNRSGAELLAGSAYLTIRANAGKGSPAQVALDGLFRDEVYHYVIMSALNKFVYRHHWRWKRLFDIVRYELDDPVPTATDAVVHRRRWPSLLSVIETFIAVNAIDKHVDDYLRSLAGDKVREMMGPYYRTDAEVQAAVDRGEHQWTRHAEMEQNPELSEHQVRAMERRFPGFISREKRAIKASHVKAIIENYRRTSLGNPNYWLRRKGFQRYSAQDAPVLLRRVLPQDPTKLLELSFTPGTSPVARLRQGSGGLEPRTLWQASLDEMSMLDIGAFMDAEDDKVFQRLTEPQADLPYQETLARLGRGSDYGKRPIKLIDDLAPAVSGAAAQ